eukprot:1199043-Prymnesium_polylepis.1
MSMLWPIIARACPGVTASNPKRMGWSSTRGTPSTEANTCAEAWNSCTPPFTGRRISRPLFPPDVKQPTAGFSKYLLSSAADAPRCSSA